MQNNSNIQQCNRCLETKSLDDFYLNPSKKSHRKICKKCFENGAKRWKEKNRKRYNARSMKWYYANPEKAKALNARNYKLQNEKREAVKAKVLADNPCIVCGDTEEILLDFHHLDPTVKEYAIASHSLTWRKMLKEISKCVVLCCRCHRRHHWRGLPLPTPLIPIDVSKYE